MMILGIIDYGVGNLLSLQRAFEYLGFFPRLVATSKEINACDKIILPGVGAFPNAMKRLGDQGIVMAIQQFVLEGRPLLGICLGMQLLFDWSDEFNGASGLKVLPGRVKELPSRNNKGELLRKPHIAWSPVSHSASYPNISQSILNNIPENENFYFVHSYSVHPDNEEHILGVASFGGERFVAMIQYDNIVGCQFHPEKSGIYGLKILENFINSN